MAITKLPRNAIADDAINASKIEDGTVAIAEVSGTITNAKLKDGDIANAKLSNSAITIRGISRSLGDSFNLNVDVNWQSVVTSDGSTVTTMEAGKGYFVDNTSASGIVKLPTSASAGDTIAIKDYAEKFGTNSLIIQRNGHKIQGNETNSEIDTNRASLVLVYVDTTKGWLYTTESNVAALDEPSFISATGGTVTTSGDFKIHTFTGDGCFVVSGLGNGPGGTGRNPAGGPTTVDYMVVAGGGSGTSGDDDEGSGSGGGAGGFRESKSPVAGTYTASPLATPTGITVTATTFPVTVGAGATAPGLSATKGSDSVFSTITSAGGGGGCRTHPGRGDDSLINGGSGGGGRRDQGGNPAGLGNKPPVSPPQGNNGGTGTGSPQPTGRAGGGGGAAAVGSNQVSAGLGGPGGNGTDVSPTFGPGFGDSNFFSGGGGGGAQSNPGYAAGAPTGGNGGGGSGGGAANPYGGGSGNAGGNGTDNTGGGGGGSGNGNPPSPTAGAGGSGIIIIRYKFQN